MRILGFSTMWPKLQQDTVTTFRFTRKDRDWVTGEVVQVVYRPRSKEREVLGVATIIGKESRDVTPDHNLNAPLVSDEEARADGFRNHLEMGLWLLMAHGKRFWIEPMNKLTLRWVERY